MSLKTQEESVHQNFYQNSQHCGCLWPLSLPPTPASVCPQPLLLMGFRRGSNGKESAFNAGGLGSVPGSGRSPGGGNGNPFQYSGLENSMAWETWWATVHGVTKSQTRLSQFHFPAFNGTSEKCGPSLWLMKTWLGHQGHPWTGWESGSAWIFKKNFLPCQSCS